MCSDRQSHGSSAVDGKATEATGGHGMITTENISRINLFGVQNMPDSWKRYFINIQAICSSVAIATPTARAFRIVADYCTVN